MDNSIQRAAQIAALNDRFRRTFAGGDVVFAVGVQALGDRHSLVPLMQAVRRHVPTAGRDPYGERDFGALWFAAVKI